MKKKYVLIKRYGDHLGLFSYVITNIGNINKALKRNQIPIIDMQSYKNPFLNENEVGKVNSWELYFEQPCNVTISDVDVNECDEITSVNRNRPNDSMRFFLNKRVSHYWNDLAKKYLRLNEKTKKYIDDQQKKYFNTDDKVLGILCRGTDYINLRPFRHPVQPSSKMVIEKAKKVMNEKKCNKIFLATEDENILNEFKSEFGNSLIYINQKRFSNTENKYLSEIEFNRKNDSYLKGLEYLTSIVLLSRCNCFIAGRTSGTIGVMLMTNGFEYTYFWDLGRYRFFPFIHSLYKQK